MVLGRDACPRMPAANGESVSALGAASSSGLSPLSDARAAAVVDALAMSAVTGEALDHRWVVAKNGVTGLDELYASSPTAGRIVISAMPQYADAEVERLVAELDIRGGTMHVNIPTDDGQLLDHQTAALATNCESDNSSCVAAAAAGAVTVACAAGFASSLACGAEPEPCPTLQMRLTCDTDGRLVRATPCVETTTHLSSSGNPHPRRGGPRCAAPGLHGVAGSGSVPRLARRAGRDGLERWVDTRNRAR